MLLYVVLGCIQHLDQIGGTGSVYTTRCTGDMVQKNREYTATCAPRGCLPGYTDGGVSHIATVMDPGRRIVGIAERVCVQDLSEAAARFEAVEATKLETPAE